MVIVVVVKVAVVVTKMSELNLFIVFGKLNIQNWRLYII